MRTSRSGSRSGDASRTDNDFDGVSYQTTWPGSLSNPALDAAVNPGSVLFSSPTFGGGQNYDRVGFEADLPRIEAADFGGICDRTTGANCVNPPPGSNFYPFFSHEERRFGRLLLAARRCEHPGNDEHVRRELLRGVRSTAVPGLPWGRVGPDPPHERLPTGVGHQPLSTRGVEQHGRVGARYWALTLRVERPGYRRSRAR